MNAALRNIILSTPYTTIPFPCKAGLFDFSISDGHGSWTWVFPDGTRSTANRPAVNLATDGVVKLIIKKPPAAWKLNDNGTNARYTGRLADLQGKVTYYLSLANCSLVTGVYAPVGTGTPTITVLSNTGLSSSDMDNTLIAYAAATKNNGTFTAAGMTRTAASDAAVATLGGRGWTITGITKV